MPSTAQASNAKSRAILAFGKFQGAYESWRALLEEDPDADILAAMQTIENHILERSSAVVPLDVPEAAGANNNALPVPNGDIEPEDEQVQENLQPLEATPIPHVEVEENIKIEEDVAPEALPDRSEAPEPSAEDIQPPAAPPAVSTSTQNATSTPSTSTNQTAGPSVPQIARPPIQYNAARRGLQRLPAYDAEGMKELCKPLGKRKAKSLEEVHGQLHGRGLTDNERAQKRVIDELHRDYNETKDSQPSPPKKMRYNPGVGNSYRDAVLLNPQAQVLESATQTSTYIERPARETAGAGPSTRPTTRHTRDAAQRRSRTPEERLKDRKKNGADKRNKGT